jgi:hypothetical protein
MEILPFDSLNFGNAFPLKQISESSTTGEDVGTSLEASDKTNSPKITSTQQAIQILEEALGVHHLNMDPLQALLMANVSPEEKLQLLKVIDPEIYARAKNLRASRPDISINDLISFCKSSDNEQFIEVIKQRTDIKPENIDQMNEKIAEAFMGFGPEAQVLIKAAQQEAVQILLKRQDISPQQLGEMFMQIGLHAQNVPEALQAIYSSGELLSKRKDINTKQVSQLFSAIALGSSPLDGANMFSTAVTTLEKNHKVNVENLVELVRETHASFPNPQEADGVFLQINSVLQQNTDLSPQEAKKQNEKPQNSNQEGALEIGGENLPSNRNNGESVSSNLNVESRGSQIQQT